MNNNITDFDKCANCGACYNICPKKAITVDDNDWYYELKVDAEKCISCGLCKKICPVNSPVQVQNAINAYGIIHNDENIVLNSSSGGAFSAIAQYVIDNGGIVYGACFSEDFKSVEIKSTETHSIEQIRRSKYVESRVDNSFIDVRQKLLLGNLVLFCGTPCQIAGLIRFLGKKHENLITCDFSCGGLPSHKMYQEYIANIERKLKNILEVNFRPKSFGWENHAIKIKAKNKVYNKWAFADNYFNCFLSQRLSIRDYCYQCEFYNNHYSDFILADYWKCKSDSNIKNNGKGISLVITNSSKAEEIINGVKNNISLTILNLQKASYNLIDKTFNEQKYIEHKNFIIRCQEVGFIKATKKFKLKNELFFKIKYFIKKLIRKVR